MSEMKIEVENEVRAILFSLGGWMSDLIYFWKVKFVEYPTKFQNLLQKFLKSKVCNAGFTHFKSK